jgi:hypothetical protein
VLILNRFLIFKYNGFFVITDITDFLLFLPFFDMFEDEKNLDAIQVRCAVLGSLMGTL